MKILVFSDIHGDTRALDRLVSQPADIFIADGDLSTFGRSLDRCGELLAPLGDKVWLLPGNHETHEQTTELCRRFGFIDFHRQLRDIGATKWVGLGYSNITPFHTPGEYTEEQIRDALNAFDGIAPLYLVSHAPPRNSRLDEVAPGKHAGSSALRTWVELNQPRYLFCGHIHECAGRSDQIGTTQCFNVGKAGYTLEI